VFVEHSGHGGTYAAPIAKHVIETFFAKQEGKPLPPPLVPNGQPLAPIAGDDPVPPPVPALTPDAARAAGTAR
jgi:hypothetical protein